ncbi:hypothetical protein M0804_014858 [Polistes exclamans]|nr:hypothetical protein M0804_014859 [Polistes exclamans]KAI4474444.1 hypothetical protein M0804_014858 [Polistes exclamans]
MSRLLSRFLATPLSLAIASRTPWNNDMCNFCTFSKMSEEEEEEEEEEEKEEDEEWEGKRREFSRVRSKTRAPSTLGKFFKWTILRERARYALCIGELKAST